MTTLVLQAGLNGSSDQMWPPSLCLPTSVLVDYLFIFFADCSWCPVLLLPTDTGQCLKSVTTWIMSWRWASCCTEAHPWAAPGLLFHKAAHCSVGCAHHRPGPFGNSTSASLPSCSVTPATIITTMMPVPSTGSNQCRCQCCVWTLQMTSSPRPTVSSFGAFFICVQLGGISGLDHAFLFVLRSYSSGGREAESQPGPPHHLSRRPHRLPGGGVATPEHLHGSGLQAICQGGHWTGEPAPGPLLMRKNEKPKKDSFSSTCSLSTACILKAFCLISPQLIDAFHPQFLPFLFMIFPVFLVYLLSFHSIYPSVLFPTLSTWFYSHRFLPSIDFLLS